MLKVQAPVKAKIHSLFLNLTKLWLFHKVNNRWEEPWQEDFESCKQLLTDDQAAESDE